MEKINVNWTEKADRVDDILAEDFNNAFKSIQDGFDNTKKEIEENKKDANDTYATKEEMNGIANNTEANADKLNSLKYYGDMNIVPSDASLFTFTTDDETMTARVSAASTDISGDIVIPYQYVVDDKVYLVTRIEKHGFYTCNNLTSVIVPNSVTVISNSSFYGCGGLTNITIGNGITSIESNAFIDCKKLENIVIPNGVTNIGAYAFGSCYKLTNVTIPNSVTNIESSTFRTCSGLTNITIPKSVTNIGFDAFANCYHLINVYYESTEEEWNAITINTTGNEPLLSATIHYNWVPAMKNYVDEKLGDIETALDNIIAIQNTLIGGETV